MEVIIDNLATALTVAIEQKTEEEKAAGYSGDSALVAGWKELHEKLVNREISVITLKA